MFVPPEGPAIVRVNLFVRSIATISDIKMVSQLVQGNPFITQLHGLVFHFIFCLTQLLSTNNRISLNHSHHVLGGLTSYQNPIYFFTYYLIISLLLLSRNDSSTVKSITKNKVSWGFLKSCPNASSKEWTFFWHMKAIY